MHYSSTEATLRTGSFSITNKYSSTVYTYECTRILGYLKDKHDWVTEQKCEYTSGCNSVSSPFLAMMALNGNVILSVSHGFVRLLLRQDRMRVTPHDRFGRFRHLLPSLFTCFSFIENIDSNRSQPSNSRNFRRRFVLLFLCVLTRWHVWLWQLPRILPCGSLTRHYWYEALRQRQLVAKSSWRKWKWFAMFLFARNFLLVLPRQSLRSSPNGRSRVTPLLTRTYRATI